MPNFWEANTLEVPINPPRYANSDAERPPSGPWALLIPNYTHFLGSTAFAIRLALVATSDAKPIRFKIGVYNNCTIPSGPV